MEGITVPFPEASEISDTSMLLKWRKVEHEHRRQSIDTKNPNISMKRRSASSVQADSLHLPLVNIKKIEAVIAIFSIIIQYIGSTLEKNSISSENPSPETKIEHLPPIISPTTSLLRKAIYNSSTAENSSRSDKHSEKAELQSFKTQNIKFTSPTQVYIGTETSYRLNELLENSMYKITLKARLALPHEIIYSTQNAIDDASTNGINSTAEKGFSVNIDESVSEWSTKERVIEVSTEGRLINVY